MTNNNPIAGHIATIALNQAPHPRIQRELAKGDREGARLALEVRILSILEIANEGDPFEVGEMHPVILASAEVLNNLPGPRIVEEVRKVLAAVIED